MRTPSASVALLSLALISAPLGVAQSAGAGNSATPSGTSSSSSRSGNTAPSATAPAVVSDAPSATAPGSASSAPDASTVSTPAVPTQAPVAPVVSTTAAGATPTPAADVSATASDPATDLTRPANAPAAVVSSPGAAGSPAAGGSGNASRRVLTSDPANGTNPAARSLDTIPAVGVTSTATVAYLRAVDAGQREAALTRVQAQLTDTNRAITRLPQVPADAPASAQVDYATALQEVQAREAQLRASLEVAQQADESGWTEARNRLAADYDAYLTATMRARAAAANASNQLVPAE